MKRFDALHPLPVFCALAVTVVVSMLTLDPVVLALSLVGAVAALASVAPRVRTVLRALPSALLLVALIALVNPLLSQNGATVLLFVNDNRYTLEALLYGVATGCMLVSVLAWCAVYSAVMTADKFMALFGRVLPTLALTVSMALRFVPDVLRRVRRVRRAQHSLGLWTGKGLVDRMRSGLAVFVAVVRQTMEDAIVTARSMRARGYGLHRRTVYVRERFGAQDACYLAATVALAVVAIAGVATGVFAISWYPMLVWAWGGVWRTVATCAWGLLCAMPSVSQLGGKASWQRSISKI